MGFATRVVVNALAIWLTSLLINEHLILVGADSALTTVGVLLTVGLVYALVNATVKPIVQFISLPLQILTLGLFSLVVNGLMLLLTAWVTDQTNWGIRIEGGFWWAVWIAFILSMVNAIISAVLIRRYDD